AEEVAEILPDLVVYDDEGKPFTVKYHLLSSMLLNELKKQHDQIEAQGAAHVRELENLEERWAEHDEAQALQLWRLQERVTRLESVEAEAAGLKPPASPAR